MNCKPVRTLFESPAILARNITVQYIIRLDWLDLLHLYRFDNID